MPEYLISFNDEWVAEHTPEQIDRKAVASRALIEQMREAGVLRFANGGLDLAVVLDWPQEVHRFRGPGEGASRPSAQEGQR